MKNRYFLYPLVLPAIFVAIQAVWLLVAYILLEISEYAAWGWILYGYYFWCASFAVLTVLLFPYAAFKYGKSISSLDGVYSKFLFSLYSTVIATASYLLLIIVIFIPLWWLILSLFVWIFLWTFLTSLLHKDTDPVEVDADEMKELREKVRELRGNKEYL